VGGGPPLERREVVAAGRPERSELDVLDLPAEVELLDDELRIEQ
jgi:hypothetical protein